MLECLGDGGDGTGASGAKSGDGQHDATDELLHLSASVRAVDLTLQNDPDLDFAHLLEDLPSDQESLQLIEEKTRGQSGNPLWFKMRQGLVTASIMKRVCTRHATVSLKPDTDCSKLVDHIVGKERKDFDCAALAWGRKKERKARKHCCTVEKKKHVNFVLKGRGLQISNKKPFLACSVDGLVSCSCDGHSQKLVEMKCPCALRQKSPKDAARQRGCQQSISTGEWSLCETSEYYYQFQTQLFVYGLSQCDLVMYTLQGILVGPVKYSEEFAENMVSKAEDFYRSQVVSVLLYGHTGSTVG